MAIFKMNRQTSHGGDLILLVALLFLAAVLQACATTRPKVSEFDGPRRTDSDVVTFYALGDWGTGDAKQRAVAIGLRDDIRRLERDEEKRALPPFVLELGDNFYPKGLPHKPWNAPEVHAILEKTFGNIYHDVTYDGSPVAFHIVPGNHDYDNLIFNGLSWGDVFHQETTAESLYTNFNYYPLAMAGIPDSNDRTEYERLRKEPIELLTLPTEISLSKNENGKVAIFALDTQAILDLYRTKKRNVVQEHWAELERLLETSQSSWKIIIGHHPIESYGNHGGYRPVDEWFWSGTRGFIPTVVRPLPYVGGIILGTLVHPGFYSLGAFSLSSTLTDLLLVQTFFPSIQDMRTSAFKQFKRKVLEIMQTHDVKLYLSGHEHTLQFIELRKEFTQDFQAFQIISGSAGKTSRVPDQKGSLLLGSGELGYVRFDAMQEELWIEFFEVEASNGRSRSIGKFRLTKEGVQRSARTRLRTSM